MSAVTNEDPKATLSYRMARGAVIILGVLLAIAFVLLVIGLIWKFGSGGSTPQSVAALSKGHYTLAPGARIVSMDVQPGRLILHIRSPAGDEVDIIDTQDAHLVGQVKSVEPARAAP